VSHYFFRIRNGQFAGESDIELADNEAAWAELTHVCGDMVGSIARNLKQNAEWQMELLDDSRKPVFRISLVAETLAPLPETTIA
jgi:hypothetical protein